MASAGFQLQKHQQRQTSEAESCPTSETSVAGRPEPTETPTTSKETSSPPVETVCPPEEAEPEVFGEDYDLSRYLPVSGQDGAGSYRIHDIPRKLLESLTTHQIPVVWPKLKHEIGKQIWGDKGFEPVPTVMQGAIDRYALGAVLFKSDRSLKERWQCLPPTCQAVASIFELIWDHDLTVDTAVEIAAPLRVQEPSLWPNHRFHGLALKGGYCRQVTVTAKGCHRVVPRALPCPDSLVLNLYRYSGRYRTDKIYVITEVIYAEEFHMSVRVSINREAVKILHRVPLAFRLHRFHVRDCSTLTHRAPYEKPLDVRWTGLTDSDHPSVYPRRARGMGDVYERLDMSRRTIDFFPNRHGNQRNVDNGGDRYGRMGN